MNVMLIQIFANCQKHVKTQLDLIDVCKSWHVTEATSQLKKDV